MNIINLEEEIEIGNRTHNFIERFFELKRNGLLKRRYFKENKKVFKFMRNHPEFRIEHIYMTPKSIVVWYSHKLGRPYKIHARSLTNGVKPYIKSHAVVYGKELS